MQPRVCTDPGGQQLTFVSCLSGDVAAGSGVSAVSFLASPSSAFSSSAFFSVVTVVIMSPLAMTLASPSAGLSFISVSWFSIIGAETPEDKDGCDGQLHAIHCEKALICSWTLLLLYPLCICHRVAKHAPKISATLTFRCKYFSSTSLRHSNFLLHRNTSENLGAQNKLKNQHLTSI